MLFDHASLRQRRGRTQTQQRFAIAPMTKRRSSNYDPDVRYKRLRVSRSILIFVLWALCGLISICVVHITPSIAFGAINYIAQAADPDQQEQQAREFYTAGQFSQAAALWQQAAQNYQAQGDVLNQAMALSNLSLANQQLGQWTKAKAAIAASLQLIQTQNNSDLSSLNTLAQALDTQANLQLTLGQAQLALTTWQQATATYQQAGDDVGVTRSLINQAQALRALGFYRRALTTLTQVNQNLQKQPNEIKVAGLRSLGNVLRVLGDLDSSRQVLQQSLLIAQHLNSAPDISATLISLGNTAQSQQDTTALTFYQQAVNKAVSPITKFQAQLNQLSLLVANKQWSAAQTLLPQIEPQITNLPPTQAGIYARINFAQSLMKIGATGKTNIARILATAIQQARRIKDQRTEAYALGTLGELYEPEQLSNAQKLTEQALVLAQAINAPDIVYRFSWQLGRLLKVQGDIPGAIASYTQAVNTLQSLRNDLVAINSDIQFSFRESVEPVYRELVSLLLQPHNANISQENLIQARQIIEFLQLAELDNFFREACLDVKPAQIDTINPEAAVIYPIILSDRLEVILSLPQQPLRHYTTFESQSRIESISEQLRQTLVIRSKREFLPFAQQVYDWLIRPLQTDLANSPVNTLVFVLDGSLRNLPMAALHDGNKYLVENYSIALAPSLQLLDPKPLERRKLKVLSAGLTEARQGFAPLDNVALELQEIKSQLPSTVLVNQEFTYNNLQAKLESTSFPIVHIATHGKFSSKATETFLLTWDDRIGIEQLDNLLKSPQNRQQIIELLVLSACETATGDKRAGLGLAGIAVKAGARSTLATLWAINDAATTQLTTNFYQQLTTTRETKAQALRSAQLSLLQNPLYKHPIYWAPYVLLGNWL